VRVNTLKSEVQADESLGEIPYKFIRDAFAYRGDLEFVLNNRIQFHWRKSLWILEGF